MIPKETIEKIKDAVDIIEVIGDFVQLKKAGSSYKGLSPFGNEKTPSFVVSPNKGIFKDFSSGRGGDAIKFIMELEGLSYIEALKWLGNKYGIEIQEKEEDEETRLARTEKDSLFIVLNFAKDHYKKILHETPEGKSIGRSYFYERGYTDQTIDAFDLGFSLDSWDGLIKEAETKQYNTDLLDKAGLIVSKEDGKQYDRFRNRAIFPIHNVSGRVIAFGARILTNDKKQPKYINSPETPVYHKSNVLYGISQAKNEIRNKDNCYLVEGYTDVISLYQAGIKNVVASSGTALTKEQIRLIKRYTNNISVLYDGDPAGIKASLRGIDLMLEEGADVHAIDLPEGEDPDSYVKELGGERFEVYLQDHKTDFITFKTNLFLADTQGDPLKKAEVINQVIESIGKIPNAIKRSVFFQKCSELLGVDETLLITEYNKNYLKQRKSEQTREEKEVHPLPDEPKEPAPQVDLENVAMMDMELEVARVLCLYGQEKIGDDEHSLAEFVVEDVSDVEFDHVGVKKVVDYYRSSQEQGIEVKSDDLLSHEDEDIQNLALTFNSKKYEISEHWEKYQIFVTQEHYDLEKLVTSSIVRLKWRKVRVLIRDAENALKEGGLTEEEEIGYIKRQMTYKNMEKSLAKMLGNVAVGRG